jgi:hypothetical protein
MLARESVPFRRVGLKQLVALCGLVLAACLPAFVRGDALNGGGARYPLDEGSRALTPGEKLPCQSGELEPYRMVKLDDLVRWYW